MIRSANRDHAEIDAALRAAASAQTPLQLRQSQAILIPALTGASLEVTAVILGLSRHRVCVLRRQFRGGHDIAETIGKRGGRRRALLSVDEEVRFLEPWQKGLRGDVKLTVATIHRAYECEVGRKVPKSTIYRLLARHGWRRQAGSAASPL